MNQAAIRAEAGAPRPALLVSVHDVSPLTLEQSRRAVDLALLAGVPVSALTLLVIPRHEDRTAIDEDAGACAWLANLASDGADLVMHGYTHRMTGRCYSPHGLVWAHGFARGQGEFYRSDASDTKMRLDRGRAILRRAGLEVATASFVPPAWLLSRQARDVIRAEGFDFHEELGGIVAKSGLHARRLVGWGSLTAVEARATAWWAAIQRGRSARDTRLAIHPADMARPATVASIRACLANFLVRCSPLGYRAFLAART
jgi:predicted deacetylase